MERRVLIGVDRGKNVVNRSHLRSAPLAHAAELIWPARS